MCEPIAIANDITIKIDRGGVAFSLRSRDYKDPQIVVIGVDLYNKSLTGDVSKTLNAIRSDSDHTPVVIYERPKDE
ncbi:MAG: hypothetical protein IIZ78_18660 [Clostridiales bacterium]|nr:hypothetical protein [Clostridiales bacterium]